MANTSAARPGRLAGLLARIARWSDGTSEAILASPEPEPAPDTPAPHRKPVAAALHVLLDDGLVHLEEGHLVIASADGARRRLQIATLAQLSLHGRAGMTSPAIRALLAEDVPVLWRDEAGRIAGMACGMSLRTTETRRAQFCAQADPALRLAIAAALVAAKIDGSRGMLRRRGVAAATLARLDRLSTAALETSGVPALLGVEGAAADLVFAQWPGLIDPASGFTFAGRRRRPPPDPVNALLSYAYAVVAGETFAGALAAGLDPHAGFLHAERAGRPALALDLMEPLRPLLADRAVLSVINRGEVRPDDFTTGPESGVRLSPRARKALLAALEDRLNRPAPAPDGGGPSLTVREAISDEAMVLARALRRGEPFTSRFGRR
jgi:CRISPR-associated endonuclease Cas1